MGKEIFDVVVKRYKKKVELWSEGQRVWVKASTGRKFDLFAQ
jgi:hypothetical protein